MKTKIQRKRLLPFKILIGYFGFLLLVFLYQMLFPFHFLINQTASVPTGIYLINDTKNQQFHVGDYIELQVPEQYKSYLYDTGLLNKGMTLIKQVGGLPGDIYCIYPDYFTINNVKIGTIFLKDRFGLDLPKLELGCKKIEEGQFLPIATNHERSFDGRYFGTEKQEEIIGKATPLWIF